MACPSIGIFVATMTGLAELCAEEVAGALDRCGINSETRLMDGQDEGALASFETIIIISSTYGHGDIPDNGQQLFKAISRSAGLSGKQFAVFALGDRTYMDTFCHAGEKWDALFGEKGAARLFPLERHDASAGSLAEDEAGSWALRWASLLRKAA